MIQSENEDGFQTLQHSDIVKPNFCDVANQQARSKLRERFLRAVTTLIGKECSLHVYSGTTLTGNFKGSDMEFQNILVDNLKTPSIGLPHSIIRTSDLHYTVFKFNPSDL